MPTQPALVATTYAAWAPHYDEWNSVDSYTVTGVEHLVASGILRDLPPGRVLDAACGTGRWAKYLGGRGWDAYMVDQSLPMLSQAAEADGGDGRPLPILAKLETLPFPDHRFDLVVCSFALLHIRDLSGAIGELARVVPEHGIVMLTDIHPTLQREWGMEKKIAIGGTQYPFPCFHYSIDHYLRAAREAGLKLLKQYQLKALIDDQAKTAVILFFFIKTGGASIAQ